MKSAVVLCVSCCLLVGCQRTPAKVEDVEKHPLLQRPDVAEGPKKDPVPKSQGLVVLPQKQPTPKRPLTLDEAVAIASDPTRDGYHAVQAVHRMAPADQIKGFRRIADAKVYEVAASAAAFLIKAGAPDAVSVACRRLPDWSAHEQMIVVNAVREVSLTSLLHFFREGAHRFRGGVVFFGQRTRLDSA